MFRYNLRKSLYHNFRMVLVIVKTPLCKEGYLWVHGLIRSISICSIIHWTALSASYLVRKKSIDDSPRSILPCIIVAENDVTQIHYIWTRVILGDFLMSRVWKSFARTLSFVEHIFARWKGVFRSRTLVMRPLCQHSGQKGLINGILVAGFWFFNQKRKNNWCFC